MNKFVYIVETRFTYGWENVWLEDNRTQTFNTRKEAENEILEVIKDSEELAEPLTVNDFRIRKRNK